MENISDNPKIILSNQTKETIQNTIDYLDEIDDETGDIPKLVEDLKKLVK